VSIVFLIGGVSPNEVAVAYAMLLLEAAMFGALGLLCSCQFRLTRTSTFVAYLTVLAFLVGLPLLGELLDRLRYSRAIGEGFSFTVVGLYAFVCGVGALFLFAMLSLWASRRLKHWPSRSFRMCVFGGIYAVIALVLSSPTTCNAVISALYGAQGNMFLPLFVNPFVAMAVLMYDQAAIGGYYNEQYWIIGATCGFALACAYLFEHLAAYRFEAMRKL